MAAVCEGQGHFRFASIYWERNETETGHVVTYTIRSSWQRNYPAFEVSGFSQKDCFFAKAQTAGDEEGDRKPLAQPHPDCTSLHRNRGA